MPFQFRKEAIEEDLNTNFPSQGQGNPPLYYSLSEVVVPTYSINSVAEGSTLPQNLQTAWDFSTGHTQIVATGTTDLITNTGFWQVDLTFIANTANAVAELRINSGLGVKIIWKAGTSATTSEVFGTEDRFVVFLRSGDKLDADCIGTQRFNIWYRQIAELNGTLVNPLGYSAA